MGFEDGFFKRSEGSTAERAAEIFGINTQAAVNFSDDLAQAGVLLSNPGEAAVHASGIAEGRLVVLRAAFDPEITPPDAAA